VALGARLPLGEPPAGSALRVALRTAQGRIEICHEPTAAEVAGLPAHMRPLASCEETALEYRLRVAIDGEERIARTVTPAGWRRTRPLAFDATLHAPAGSRRVAVEFLPIEPPGLAAEAAERFAQLPRLELDRIVELEAGRIALVLLDDRGELRLRTAR